MVEGIVAYAPLFASALAIAAIATVYYLLNKKVSAIEETVDKLHQDLEELQIENQAFEDPVVEQDEDDLFEKNIKDLAERLFELLKARNDVEDVTTYREMTDVIKDMDADDPELKDELVDFYESAIRLEYSDDQLSEPEKEKMKRTAIDLIKRTGQSPEAQR